ncbi:hypothetical protein F5Y14DRAFT_388008 [Nemania sp. NC0429]|nr:hypothetical protein F5Y14DRAFT_387607 [Nemania sp. NC0429]KAI1109910.1 hypothetical protein F5Y14DRAFT_388008 [Nemania sp. NC0429]
MGRSFQFEFRPHQTLGIVGAFTEWDESPGNRRALTREQLMIALLHARGDLDVSPLPLNASAEEPSVFMRLNVLDDSRRAFYRTRQQRLANVWNMGAHFFWLPVYLNTSHGNFCVLGSFSSTTSKLSRLDLVVYDIRKGQLIPRFIKSTSGTGAVPRPPSSLQQPIHTLPFHSYLILLSIPPTIATLCLCRALGPRSSSRINTSSGGGEVSRGTSLLEKYKNRPHQDGILAGVTFFQWLTSYGRKAHGEDYCRVKMMLHHPFGTAFRQVRTTPMLRLRLPVDGCTASAMTRITTASTMTPPMLMSLRTGKLELLKTMCLAVRMAGQPTARATRTPGTVHQTAS